MAWRDSTVSVIDLPHSFPEAGMQEPPIPASGQQDQFLKNLVQSLQHEWRRALREECQITFEKALHKELPLALEKELPGALLASSVAGVHSPSAQGDIKPARDSQKPTPPMQTVSSPRPSILQAVPGLPDLPARRDTKPAQANQRQPGARQSHRRSMTLNEHQELAFAELPSGDSQVTPANIWVSPRMVESRKHFPQSAKARFRQSIAPERVSRATNGQKQVQIVPSGEQLNARGSLNSMSLQQSAFARIRSFMDMGSEPSCRGDEDLSRAKRLQIDAFDLTESRMFMMLTTSLITLNACVIGVETEWIARQGHDKTPPAFTILDLCFCVAFAMELFIRMFAFRSHFFVYDWQWNLFDTVLVTLQVFELTLGQGFSSNLTFMRTLRVLRVVRVLRLMRAASAGGVLRSIIGSIAASTKPLLSTILLISFLVYVAGVAMTQLITARVQGSFDVTAKVELEEHFGSVPRSCLVLFQSMTGGLDWGDVANPLIEHISPLMALLLCFYVAFAQFVLLNVITGVLLEASIASQGDQKSSHVVTRLTDFLSETHDPEVLTWEELQERLEDETKLLSLQSMDLDPREARGLFNLLDVDNQGTVRSLEFVMACLRLRGDAKAIDLCMLMYENRAWCSRAEQKLAQIQTHLAGGDAEELLELPPQSSTSMTPQTSESLTSLSWTPQPSAGSCTSDLPGAGRRATNTSVSSMDSLDEEESYLPYEEGPLTMTEVERFSITEG